MHDQSPGRRPYYPRGRRAQAEADARASEGASDAAQSRTGGARLQDAGEGFRQYAEADDRIAAGGGRVSRGAVDRRVKGHKVKSTVFGQGRRLARHGKKARRSAAHDRGPPRPKDRAAFEIRNFPKKKPGSPPLARELDLAVLSR